MPFVPLSRAGFFPDGFGDYRVPCDFFNDMFEVKRSPPPGLSVRLSDPTSATGFSVQHGEFETPYTVCGPPRCVCVLRVGRLPSRDCVCVYVCVCVRLSGPRAHAGRVQDRSV